MNQKIMTYLVAVQINEKIKCIDHIETDELMRPGTCYIYIGRDNYSGYDIYLDYNTREYKAADAF